MKKIILGLSAVLFISFICPAQIGVNVSLPKLGKNKDKDKDKETKTNDNSNKETNTTATKSPENTVNWPANAKYDDKDNRCANELKNDNEDHFNFGISEVQRGVKDIIKTFEQGGNTLTDIENVKKDYPKFEACEYNMIKYYIEKARTVKKWGLNTVNYADGNETANWFLNNMFVEFDACAKKYIVPNVNSFIDLADQRMKMGRAKEAIEFIQAAQMRCDEVLLVRPEQPDIITAMKDVKTFNDKIMAEKAKVYTSEIHKKYAGKIVFSKSPIVVKQENESNFSDTFLGTDKIYAMAYLDGTFKEKLEVVPTGTVRSIDVHVYIDGKDWNNESPETNSKYQNKCIIYRLPKDIASSSYIDFDILGDIAVIKKAEVDMIIAKILSGLSARSHTIGILLSKDHNIAYGEFKIDLSQGQEALKGMEAKYTDAAISNARMPEAGMKDPALEATIKSLCTNNSDYTSNGYKPQRIVIESEGWYEELDALGLVVARSLVVWVAYKKSDGTCEVAETFVAKDNKGGGQFGPVRYWKSFLPPNDVMQIKCENVLK